LSLQKKRARFSERTWCTVEAWLHDFSATMRLNPALLLQGTSSGASDSAACSWSSLSRPRARALKSVRPVHHSDLVFIMYIGSISSSHRTVYGTHGLTELCWTKSASQSLSHSHGSDRAGAPPLGMNKINGAVWVPFRRVFSLQLRATRHHPLLRLGLRRQRPQPAVCTPTNNLLSTTRSVAMARSCCVCVAPMPSFLLLHSPALPPRLRPYHHFASAVSSSSA
jgi:hypothetical protein